MFNKPAAFLFVITILVVLFPVNFNPLYAQVHTAVPFLLINSSPEASGQGGASISRITDDPYAINFNPAHLGFSSIQTNTMISFYPRHKSFCLRSSN